MELIQTNHLLMNQVEFEQKSYFFEWRIYSRISIKLIAAGLIWFGQDEEVKNYRIHALSKAYAIDIICPHAMARKKIWNKKPTV